MKGWKFVALRQLDTSAKPVSAPWTVPLRSDTGGSACDVRSRDALRGRAGKINGECFCFSNQRQPTAFFCAQYGTQLMTAFYIHLVQEKENRQKKPDIIR